MTERPTLPASTFVPSVPRRAADPAESLRALIAGSPVAIIALDERHRLELCNPAFERLFQYTERELRGRNPDRLLASPELFAEAGGISRRVLQGERVNATSLRRRRDGSLVDVDIHGIPLLAGGRVAGVYALYLDRTDRTDRSGRSRPQTPPDLLASLDHARLDHARPDHKRPDRASLHHEQQDDRLGAARKLHTAMTQQLTMLNRNLARLSRLTWDASDDAQALLQEAREIAEQCAASSRGAAHLLTAPGPQPLAAVEIASGASLTRREREVLRLLAEGMTSREAASRLSISSRTVETHRGSIGRKLGLASLAELVRFAIRSGIVEHV